jgi:hypothetical protein
MATLHRRSFVKAASTPMSSRSRSCCVRPPRKASLGRLPLFEWLLRQLGFENWNDVDDALNDPALEERSPDGTSRFAEILVARSSRRGLPPSLIETYDASVLRDWDAVVSRRAASYGVPRLKYFQYLCLLAVEHLLTRLRENESALLADLNSQWADFEYTSSDLKKLAFSLATGSGKTLLMHVNLKQWLRIFGKETVDGIILITPSELLTRQHVSELHLSGIGASPFDAEAMSLFDADALVKVIDINKLREVKGVRTVAVESFGSRNLVLIDEAHRGSRSDDRVWKDNRDQLSRDGFAFEYSATFRQAVAASGDAELAMEYAKSIAFDYAYQRFYRDGFGKDFRVRNAEFPDESEEAELYFVAALLTFFQQQIGFERDSTAARGSSIEAPLLLAVGTTVQKSVSSKAPSDVQIVLARLRSFIENRTEAIARIRRLLDDPKALLSMDGHPLVYGDLDLLRARYSAEALYDDLRRKTFNAGAGGEVRLTRFTAVEGEIHVSVEACKPFAVVNVGDAQALFDHLVANLGFAGDQETGSPADALFDRVSEESSTIAMLIGARKFLEGWDSHRPSCMLLLNVGKSEGAQIIQLFGRGVRLRGYDGSLRRSSRDMLRPLAPKNLGILETLEIFGIRANYMKRFREVLDIEGISKTFDTMRILATDVRIPDTPPLKILRTVGPSFVEHCPEVVFDAAASDVTALVDWYPRVLHYGTTKQKSEEIVRQRLVLDAHQLSFLDRDRLYVTLLALKRSRHWHNLVIPRDAIDALLDRNDWYVLYADGSMKTPTGLASIRGWQMAVEALAASYLTRWYRSKQREYEASRLQVGTLTAEDPVIVHQYEVWYDGEDLRLGHLLDGGKAGAGDPIQFIRFDESIYEPLLYVSDDTACATIPMGLVKSERDFVVSLVKFVNAGGFSEYKAEMFVLRNASRGKGMGFAEAENFHPDFLLWLCRGSTQAILFVEPHGLAHETEGFESAKIGFAKTVKGIEKRLGDPHLRLMASVISQTPRANIPWIRDVDTSTIDEYNLHFAEDPDHVSAIVKKGLRILDESASSVPA